MEHEVCGATACDFGYGFDWRDYGNHQGYSHLEELLIYQPKAGKSRPGSIYIALTGTWKGQARREMVWCLSRNISRLMMDQKKPFHSP
jgi:hypothetical protein